MLYQSSSVTCDVLVSRTGASSIFAWQRAVVGTDSWWGNLGVVFVLFCFSIMLSTDNSLSHRPSIQELGVCFSKMEKCEHYGKGASMQKHFLPPQLLTAVCHLMWQALGRWGECGPVLQNLQLSMGVRQRSHRHTVNHGSSDDCPWETGAVRSHSRNGRGLVGWACITPEPLWRILSCHSWAAITRNMKSHVIKWALRLVPRGRAALHSTSASVEGGRRAPPRGVSHDVGLAVGFWHVFLIEICKLYIWVPVTESHIPCSSSFRAADQPIFGRWDPPRGLSPAPASLRSL